MKCEKCHRKGALVRQKYHRGNELFEIDPFVFRYYLCQWHLAAENRRAKKMKFKPMKRVEYKPDEEFGL